MQKNKKEITCPKCNSNMIRVSGPNGYVKKEGEPAYRGSHIVYYYCLKCNHQWKKSQ